MKIRNKTEYMHGIDTDLMRLDRFGTKCIDFWCAAG